MLRQLQRRACVRVAVVSAAGRMKAKTRSEAFFSAFLRIGCESRGVDALWHSLAQARRCSGLHDKTKLNKIAILLRAFRQRERTPCPPASRSTKTSRRLLDGMSKSAIDSNPLCRNKSGVRPRQLPIPTDTHNTKCETHALNRAAHAAPPWQPHPSQPRSPLCRSRHCGS